METNYLAWDNPELDPAVEWQGIKYLSTSDITGFDTVITVHLARSTQGLSAESILVEGGESRTQLDYEIFPLSGVNQQIPNGETEIQVRFPLRGDYSSYTIRLTDGGDNPLHPFFDRASFTFYVDCPLGDCRASGLAADKKPAQRPAIDLKTKDYRGFLEVLLHWIRRSNPSWSDVSPASFERLIAELLCYHADRLSYFQDRIAAEAFIDTARQRHAMRQHGLLLGYELDDGAAASTLLAFDVSQTGVLPSGVTVEHRGRPGEAPLMYVSQTASRLDPAWNRAQLIPAAWPGASEAVLPEGSKGLLLWGRGLGLYLGQKLVLSQGSRVVVIDLTQVAEFRSAGWVANPADASTGTEVDLTRIAWEPQTPVVFEPWNPNPPFFIQGNLVAAVQGVPRTAVAGSGSVAASDAVQIKLNRRNSIVAPRQLEGDETPDYQLRALLVPEGPVIFETDETGRSVPALEVRIDGELWSREASLWESSSYDYHYTAKSDNDGRIWIGFGDGVHGRELPVSRQDSHTFFPEVFIEIRYRIGASDMGNCARGALNRIMPAGSASPVSADIDALGITRVTNVVPGMGGRAPESVEAARFSISASIRHGRLQRAVTLADYAQAAMQVSGVARATAVNLGGIFNTVLVLVDPRGQGDLDPVVRDKVDAQLEQFRMAGREHWVTAPNYMPLEVRLAICPQSTALPHKVRELVLAALRPGSDDRQGYFHPDRFSFGDDVHLGDMLALVHAVAGVRSVKALFFRPLRDPGTPLVREVIETHPLEVARVDGNDNRPENGILKVYIMGLDDESLIRREIGYPRGEPLFLADGPQVSNPGEIL